MKITLDVDCTPAEARAFLGLPDVKAMQDRLMAQMQEQMGEKLASMDPDAMIRTWMPMGLQGLEQMQSAFWSQMAGSAKASPDSDKS